MFSLWLFYSFGRASRDGYDGIFGMDCMGNTILYQLAQLSVTLPQTRSPGANHRSFLRCNWDVPGLYVLYRYCTRDLSPTMNLPSSPSLLSIVVGCMYVTMYILCALYSIVEYIY